MDRVDGLDVHPLADDPFPIRLADAGEALLQLLLQRLVALGDGEADLVAVEVAHRDEAGGIRRGVDVEVGHLQIGDEGIQLAAEGRPQHGVVVIEGAQARGGEVLAGVVLLVAPVTTPTLSCSR